MSLLRLTPEVRRLRRVARACAAGEVTRIEYRQTRRDVIEQFAESFGQGDDRTIPREDLDVTLRRHEVLNTEAAPPQSVWRWLPFFGILLLAAFASQWAFAVEIPAVKERDPNPASSLRIRVSELTWDLPEDVDDIDREAIETFLDEQLAEMRARNAPLEHGFSADELEQVGRFLNAIGVHDESTTFSTSDLEDLAALVATQKERRGVSVAQLEEIAQALQARVRERGYPLARAYVPRQTVLDGSVRLGVLVGRLASVEVEGADPSLISRFAENLGRPIKDEELETKLNGLNRLPGVRAQASFVPGDEVGASDMLLSVVDEQRFRGIAQIDNYGMEALGEERLSLLAQVNNPRGVGDQIEIDFTASLESADQKQGRLSYLTPLINGRYDGRVSVASANLDWQEALGIEGQGLLLDAAVRDTRVFTRTQRHEYEVLIGVHDLHWDGLIDQRAWFVGAGMNGHRLWDRRRLALEGGLQAILGGLDATRDGQDSNFSLARLSARAWAPWQLPVVDVGVKAVLGLEAQASSDLLPTTQRMSMTGASANRGFAQAGLLVDQGVLLKGELLFAAPLGEWGVFMDAGYGERNNATEDWYQLTSVGVSWQARLFSRDASYLMSKLSVATPVAHKGSEWIVDSIGEVDEDTRVFWSLQYSH
jgi:hemolysin activation/secretion protein